MKDEIAACLPRLRAYARSLVFRYALTAQYEADDLVNEAIIGVLTGTRVIPEGFTVRAILFSAVRSMASSSKKKVVRRKEQWIGEYGDDAWLGDDATSRLLEDDVALKELQDELWDKVGHDDFEVAVAFSILLEGGNRGDIAAALGITPDEATTVRIRAVRRAHR